MNLYIRTTTARREKVLEAMGFAVEIAEYVTNETDIEVAAWGTVYGAPIGTLSWTARVDNHAQIIGIGDQLIGDAKYLELTSGAAELFETAPEDNLTEFVGFAGSGTGEGQYASVVMAQCESGRIADAMAWAVDMMHHASSVTGRDVSLVRSLYGDWGSLAWISLADTAEQIDEANAALAADESYIGKVDSGKGLFVPGATTGRLSRRLG